ncbi:MAG: hypothetical protein ACPGWR_04650 [Ardenticatenaceae bacterium]
MSGLFTQLTHEYYTFSQEEPELERDEARAQKGRPLRRCSL